MDQQPKTSFIPKKPIQTASKTAPLRSAKSTGKAIFTLIATIIFIASIAALGGVYFYKFALQRQIEDQVASLQKAKDEFDEDFIKTASRLDLRLSSAAELLENHLSPSALFELLENYTLHTVSFGNFNFSDTKEGHIKVEGSGVSQRFESIVLQSDSFGDSEVMRNVLFEGLEPDLENNVINFTFSATLDPKVVLYKNTLPENFQSNVIED